MRSAQPATGTLAIDPERHTILLEFAAYPADDAALDAALDEGYRAKPEFHLTIAGFGAINRALATIPEPDRADAFGRVVALARSLDWTVEPTGRFARINKTDDGEPHNDPAHRSSIIEMVTCSAMDTFYDGLRAMFPEAELVTPPPHVTLATRLDHKGIALRSDADIVRFARPFDTNERGDLGR